MTATRLLRSVFLVALISFIGAPAASPAGPFQFFSVTPCRIVDTRTTPNGPTAGPSLAGGIPRSFPIMNLCGVPVTAKAVALNVTIVGPTVDGFLSIYPHNTSAPLVSTINFVAGEPALANGAIVPLTVDPSLHISVLLGTQGGGNAHVILDVTGYFQ
jgi:hypothetical protein